MKKNFLLLLLMTLLPLAGWAADVIAGDYTATIATQYVALTDATTGVTAPEITALKKGEADYFAAVTKMTLVDENGNLVDGTAIKTAGKYTWVINFNDGSDAKVMKVPFYVAVPATSNFDIVWNATTWEAANADGHGLKLYYADYEARTPKQYLDYGWWHEDDMAQKLFTKMWDQEDLESVWGQNFRRNWISAINCIDRSWPERTSNGEANTLKINSTDPDADDYTALSEPGGMPSETWKESGYPWYVFYTGTNTSKFVPAFVYTEGANTYYDIAKYASGDLASFGPEGSAYLIMSGLFADAGYPLTLDVNNKNGEVNNAEAYAAKLANLKVLLIPDGALTATVENATDLTEANVTILCNNLPYIGAEQKPAFSGENFNATVTYTPATANEAITLVEGRDFEAVYNAAGDDYKSVGTHEFTVNFIGAYAGSKGATYEIEKAHVNINLAYIYKTYGEADPVLPAANTFATEAEYNDALTAYTNKLGFEIDASTPLKGTDVKADIAKYLVFKRASGDQNQGEDVKEYEYYYDKAANVGECNYTFSFLQTKSLLIIQPKAVTIDVTPAYKKYHKTVALGYVVNDDAATADVVEGLKAQLADKDKALATGTPGANDIIKSISWAGAGTDDGEAVNADLVDGKPVFRNQGTGYAFTVESNSANYTVTVATPTGFAIVPTDEANITVEVPADEANGAVDGKFIYKGTAWEPKPLVKDGDFKLVENTDYTVSWNKNVDASADAECIVTLTGSYTSATPITTKFTISKADLVVKPVSANAEGNYTIAYETFKGTETAQGEYQRESVPAHAYFSVNPANITVVKGQEIEQDVYVLEIQLPEGVTEITAKNYNVSLGTALLALNNKPVLRVRPAQNQPGKVYDGNEPTAEELAALAIEVQEVVGGDYRPATDEQKAALKILGTPVYTITKAPGVNVGRYRLTVTGPAVLKDYNVEYDNTHGNNSSRNYPITRAPYYIVVNNNPANLGTASKTYGDPDPTFTVTAATRTGEGTTASPYVYTAAAGIAVPNTVRAIHFNNYNGADDAGEHTIFVQRNAGSNWNPNWQSFATGWENGNYTFYSVNGVLTTAKKAITFRAEPKEKVYGTADPALTIVPDPIVTTEYSEALIRQNGAYAAFDITREKAGAADGEEVGTYKITLALKDVNASEPGVQVHNSLRNFEVSIDPTEVFLTINKATYTVRANDQWIDYAGDINPLDVTITLPGNETLRWQKAGINESADATAAREANNAKIEALGTLEVLPGKKAIGANKDAYKWTQKANANYELATGEAANYTVPATAHTKEYTYVDGFCNGYLTVYPLTRIPLDMDNLAQVLEDHKGLPGITFVLPERGMTANNWYGWVLPFDVTAEELFGDIWGYGAAETLNAKKSTGNRVSFNLSIGKIAANTPFIAKVATTIPKAAMKQIEITGKTIPADVTYYADGKAVNAVSASNDGTVKFIGLYDDKKGFAENEMYLARKTNEDENEFWPGGSNSTSVTLKKTNAYLQLGGDASHAVIFIEEEDGTYTAINGLSVDALEGANADGCYTVNGVKVAAPTQKGLYIMDGKKVLVK